MVVQALGTGHESNKGTVERHSWRHDVGRAAVLTLLAGFIYVLSSGGHAYSVDEITNYASARALVETGSPDLFGDQPFPREQLLTLQHPRTDRMVGRYGLLSWVVISPAYFFARSVDSMPPLPSPDFPQPSAVRPVAVLLYAPAITALLVGATFVLGRNLGLRPRNAAAAALVLAFASPVWVYAQGLANMPLAVLFSVLAFAAVTSARSSAGAWAVAGGLAGLSALTRPEFVILASVLGVLALFSEEQLSRAGLTRGLAFGAAWVIVAVPGIGLWNLYRTGDFFDVGYRSATLLWQTDRAYIGIFGVLASPSFGLLVFMPVAAVGLWGMLSAVSHRRVWLSVLALIVLAVIGYGSFDDWSGGVSWGPRYLTSITPFLALGVGAVLQAPSTTLSIRLMTLGLAAWSTGLSVLGVLFDYQSGWRNLWDHGARPEQIEWNPHFSLIGAHLRLARQWVDGLIGPDLFIAHRVGVWTIAMLVMGLLVILGLAVTIEARGTPRQLKGLGRRFTVGRRHRLRSDSGDTGHG